MGASLTCKMYFSKNRQIWQNYESCYIKSFKYKLEIMDGGIERSLPVSHVKRLEDVSVCDFHDNDVHGQHDGHQ